MFITLNTLKTILCRVYSVLFVCLLISSFTQRKAKVRNKYNLNAIKNAWMVSSGFEPGAGRRIKGWNSQKNPQGYGSLPRCCFIIVHVSQNEY